MENKTNILHTSGKITLAFLAFVLMLIGWIGNVFSYGTQSGTLLDLRRGSRVTDYILYQPFEDTYTMYFGTQSVTGSGTTGYIPGTSTALPRLQYNASTLTFNFVGATLQNEGVDVTVSTDLTGYITVTGGTGTGNVLTNTTLDGTGTISANVSLSGNITANSLEITPTELSSVNNATGELQAQITTATGSITNHVHTGADGTAQIAHDSITGTGTNSHITLDAHLASSSDPHGATLTQTAATIAGVNAPYIAQKNGTGTGITLAGNTNFPSGRWDSNGNFGLGTTTPQKKLHVYENLNNALESRIENPGTGTNSRAIYRMVNDVSTASFAFSGSNYSGGGRVLSFSQNDVLGMMQFWNAGVKALQFDTIGDATFVGTVTASNFVGNVDIDNIGGIVITSPAEGHKLVFDSSLNVVNATDTAITAWSGITGVPTDNGSVSATSAAGYIPVAGSDGKLDYSWQKDVIRLTGTTTSPEAGAYGQLYVQISSSGGSGVDEYTKLLLHMDNPGTSTFVDSSASAHTVTAVADAIGTTTAKFGSGGGYFDGTGDALAIPDSDDFALGDTYTIEAWVYLTSTSGGVRWITGQYQDGNNYYSLGYSATQLFFQIVSGGSAIINNTWMTALPTNQWVHVMASGEANMHYLFVNGNSNGGLSDADDIPNMAGVLYIGNSATSNALVGYMDEFRVLKGFCAETGTFTVKSVPYITNHPQYAAKYIDPINGNTVFEILTPGTATTEASYIYNNATTTVWGLGTNTAITSGTASGYYAGWSNRPIRVTAVDIASTQKIKENIKPMHIKPEQLEAESKAKPVYIAEKKPAWFTANEVNYTYVGSDTATYVDTAAMESDFAEYIELEWASDLNQNVHIEAVQKTQQKYFWELFDRIQPKSWNPIDDLRMTRKGLVVEDVPDEIKGADGQSIDQMAVVTYQTLALQDLKDSIVDIMQALKDLANTGTFTTQAINDRLEAMRIAP